MPRRFCAGARSRIEQDASRLCIARSLLSVLRAAQPCRLRLTTLRLSALDVMSPTIALVDWEEMIAKLAPWQRGLLARSSAFAHAREDPDAVLAVVLGQSRIDPLALEGVLAHYLLHVHCRRDTGFAMRVFGSVAAWRVLVERSKIVLARVLATTDRLELEDQVRQGRVAIGLISASSAAASDRCSSCSTSASSCLRQSRRLPRSRRLSATWSSSSSAHSRSRWRSATRTTTLRRSRISAACSCPVRFGAARNGTSSDA